MQLFCFKFLYYTFALIKYNNNPTNSSHAGVARIVGLIQTKWKTL